jgi:hypothetical protein
MFIRSFANILLFGLLFVLSALQAARAGEKVWTLESALQVIENDKEDPSKRVAAIRFLTEQNAKVCIPRLVKVLQGKYDVVALNILWAFADFKDSKAWPHITAYEKEIKDGQLDLPGKLNTALSQAKANCQPKK